ncbi:MAG: DUF2249 domain-containing protein [Hyphomicrobiaceae bacterium]|nr:DUF2249 domain-containing protein [Hyphomicrobiaceae bacterium]
MTAEAPPVWNSADGTHIDVRGLPPPEPMVAVIALIERPETGDIIIVHLEREPVFLFPELDERGWSYEPIPGDPGEFRLRLTRGA